MKSINQLIFKEKLISNERNSTSNLFDAIKSKKAEESNK